MNIIDYILLGVLLVIGIINFIMGFHKAGLNNLVTLIKIALIVILSPILVGVITESFGLDGIAESINSSIPLNVDLGNMIVSVVAYLIVIIVLAIVLGIIFMLLKKLFRKINFSFTPLKWIDRFVGFFFSVLLYGIILFALTGFIAQIPVESMQTLFAESAVMKINPFMNMFAEFVDFTWLKNMIDVLNGTV